MKIYRPSNQRLLRLRQNKAVRFPHNQAMTGGALMIPVKRGPRVLPTLNRIKPIRFSM